MNIRECYRILQVPAGASLDEIKAAFRKRAFQLHPDLNPSPNAAAQFREVNEAYVLLNQALKGEPGPRAKTAGGASAHSTAGGPGQTKTQKAKAEKAYSSQRATGFGFFSGQQPGGQQPGAGNFASGNQASGTFYFKEEEVLRDLLADPFARQVFEDIYSQLRQGKPSAPTGQRWQPGANPFQSAKGQEQTPAKRRRLNIQWGEKSLDLDMSKGVIGGIKGWMRGQLDHEQTVHYPAMALGPGRTLRLTVSSRFGDPKTVEITLPPDFVVGRPIRLKGLGRKLGPFTGDLILRVLAR